LSFKITKAHRCTLKTNFFQSNSMAKRPLI
jgi:hypothetical protein